MSSSKRSLTDKPLSTKFPFKSEAPRPPRMNTDEFTYSDDDQKSSSGDSLSSEEDFGQKDEKYEDWVDDVF